MQVPFVAFLINAFAKNKVEGFVLMKATGFMILFPVASFFFVDAKEWVFAIAPAHWPAKAIQYLLLKPAIDQGLIKINLGIYGYIALGAAYNALFIILTYR
jgi:fluoroquinolone transport system permease protein